LTKKDYYRKQFKEGKTIQGIVTESNAKYSTVYQAVKDLKKPRFQINSISTIQKNDIVKQYLNGETTKNIGTNYNISYKSVARILKSCGIDLSGNGQRQYKLNEYYFDVIDTPSKAYIIGFLYADGNNYVPKNTISMSLQECDRNTLEWIREEINSKKPLDFIDYSKKNYYNHNYKNQYRLTMFSSHMSQKLNSLGMLQNKSINLKFPNWLSEELLSHFIRGYFDGNGCISSYTTKSEKEQISVSITSTNDFCIGMKSAIQNALFNMGGCISDASNHNGITKVLIFTGKKQCKKLLDWLYCDASCYLNRKYQKYYNIFYNGK